MLTLKTKICSKCKEELPITKEYFYRDNRDVKDGFWHMCKKCGSKKAKKYNDAHKNENREYHREYMRERRNSEKGPRILFLKSIHAWIRKHKPKKEYCSICNEHRKLELSNISGLYKRDIDDYHWLCYYCHRLYDKLLKVHRGGS